MSMPGLEECGLPECIRNQPFRKPSLTEMKPHEQLFHINMKNSVSMGNKKLKQSIQRTMSHIVREIIKSIL